jgi:hypothetical protein
MRLSRTFGFVAFAALLSSPASAIDGVGVVEDGVPSANQRNAVAATLIDPDFRTKLLAAGTDPLENPSGVITNYGMLIDGTLTEPDENTDVVFPRKPGGPTANFDYGRHFLYQGHENGAPKAYVTRINLDVPRGDIHRITLLTPVDAATGTTGLGSIDGSTYNPFTRTLLFTQEAGSNGGVFQLTTGWPSQLTKLDAFLGKAGYEGIHADRFGNIYIIEDTGGATSSTTAPVNLNKGRQPNSFVYRFVPNNSNRIEDGGDLQALQVTVDGTPIVFGGTAPQQRDADISSTAQLKLHTRGTHYPVKWVTIHTSKAGDTAPFDANAAAKTAGATPFKRPENLAWLPGSDFRTFFFDPTGDTDSVAGENPFLQTRGAYGAIFRVDLNRRGDDHDHGHDDHHGRDDDRHGQPQSSFDGQISLFVLGDHDHNSFDNLAFINERQLLAAEDRGDLLHTELNTLDSIWAFNLPNGKATRFVALGRDATSITHGEDNEPTGLFVSNGGIEKGQSLGTDESLENAHGFFTMQHGDNKTFEFFRARARHETLAPVAVQ